MRQASEIKRSVRQSWRFGTAETQDWQARCACEFLHYYVQVETGFEPVLRDKICAPRNASACPKHRMFRVSNRRMDIYAVCLRVGAGHPCPADVHETNFITS